MFKTLFKYLLGDFCCGTSTGDSADAPVYVKYQTSHSKVSTTQLPNRVRVNRDFELCSRIKNDKSNEKSLQVNFFLDFSFIS